MEEKEDEEEKEAPGTVRIITHTQCILSTTCPTAPVRATRQTADSPSILGVPGPVVAQRAHLVHQVFKQRELAGL